MRHNGYDYPDTTTVDHVEYNLDAITTSADAAGRIMRSWIKEGNPAITMYFPKPERYAVYWAKHQYIKDDFPSPTYDETCPICHTDLSFEIGEAYSNGVYGEIECRCGATLQPAATRRVSLSIVGVGYVGACQGLFRVMCNACPHKKTCNSGYEPDTYHEDAVKPIVLARQHAQMIKCLDHLQDRLDGVYPDSVEIVDYCKVADMDTRKEEPDECCMPVIYKLADILCSTCPRNGRPCHKEETNITGLAVCVRHARDRLAGKYPEALR